MDGLAGFDAARRAGLVTALAAAMTAALTAAATTKVQPAGPHG